MFQRTDDQSPGYAFNGSTITAVSSNKNIGSEMDLTLAYQIDKNFSAVVGGAHFFAGEYLKENGLGSDGDFYYLQTKATF